MLPVFSPVAPVRVIYSDLDGTMLGRNGSFVHDPDGASTLDPSRALLSALERGIDVVPCSGRSLPGLIGDARILGLGNAIAEMGAIIAYEHGRELVRNLGAYPGGDELPVRYMERAGALEVIFSSFPLEHHTPWSTRREYTHLLRGLAGTEEVNRALEAAGVGWCELVDNGRLHGAYAGLPAGASHAYHLLSRGTSKGSAIALDRARRGLAAAECVAIGDAVADLEMAAQTGLMVLTSESVDEDPALAEAASKLSNVRLTPRPGNLGWADVVSMIASAS